VGVVGVGVGVGVAVGVGVGVIVGVGVGVLGGNVGWMMVITVAGAVETGVCWLRFCRLRMLLIATVRRTGMVSKAVINSR
jgi:hypothetical protein